MCVWPVSIYCYLSSVCLFDTYPFPVTRFLCIYLTRVLYLLPDFCVFTWHMSFACYQISVYLLDTRPLPVTRFLCIYLTRVLCLLPDFCVFTWHVSFACYQISVYLLHTCPLPVTRFLCIYLTRVLCLLPDFCVFNWHVSFACYQISVYLIDTCPLPVTNAVLLNNSTHFLPFLLCGPEVAQQILSFCGLLLSSSSSVIFQAVTQFSSYHSTWYSPQSQPLAAYFYVTKTNRRSKVKKGPRCDFVLQNTGWT
jgi:hypothetical protein